MGANEKYEAAMHGGEHDFGSADQVSANRVRFMSESKLDRFIAMIRAEAKAEALNEVLTVLHAEIEDAPPANHEEDNYEAGYIAGLDFLLNAKALANQYKEAPSA